MKNISALQTSKLRIIQVKPLTDPGFHRNETTFISSVSFTGIVLEGFHKSTEVHICITYFSDLYS